MGDAVICGDYRYSLTRGCGSGEHIAWIMLNPSTADANFDDATIRRVTAFSASWGNGSLEVVNLFASRATDPHALLRAEDPVGPKNAAYIRRALGRSTRVVAAWGAKEDRRVQVEAAKIADLALRRGITLSCLGLTANGHPRHPLYVPGDREPTSYRA